MAAIEIRADARRRARPGRAPSGRADAYARGMNERTCSRCQGALRVGFLEDKGERGSIAASRVLSWIDGQAQKGAFGGAKVLGKQRHDVTAYRCSQCDHLDLFVD
jgi:hypothetical protein